MFKKLAVVLALMYAAPSHAGFIFQLSGDITASQTPADVSIPINVGDPFVGTFTYTPENRTFNSSTPGPCYEDLISFGFVMGESIISSAFPVACFAIFGVIDFPDSNAYPPGYFADDFHWALDIGDPLPGADALRDGLLGSQWTWSAIDSQFRGIHVIGDVTSVTEVPEPATFAVLAFGLAGAGVSRLMLRRTV